MAIKHNKISIAQFIFEILIFFVFLAGCIWLFNDRSIEYLSGDGLYLVYLTVGVILIALLKIVLSFLVWKVTINDEEGCVKFRTVLNTYVFKSSDIKEWGIRILSEPAKYSVGLIKDYYFECTKNDGSIFIYPLTRKNYGSISIPNFAQRLSKILEKLPKEYEQLNQFTKWFGIPRLKYIFWYLLSI